MRSYISHLECSFCSKKYSHEIPIRLCESDGKPLLARYDLDAVSETMNPESLKDRVSTMWRYWEVMPVLEPENIFSLGEGFTPLLKANRLGVERGMPQLFIKDESVNPTGSFKARGLSAAVSKAFEIGIRKLTMPSAGNAGGAMAAYAALANMEAQVFMPKDAPLANILECKAYGANLSLVDGFITDAGKLSNAAAELHGFFDVSTLREPYRVEGKKTMGYEIVEQLQFTVPDVIVYPTGGGTGIIGIWKALEEMESLEWIGPERPRMICVQASGCCPIVNAYMSGTEFAQEIPNPKTLASGLRVPSAIGDFLILRAIRESAGTAVSVDDEEMKNGVRNLSVSQGIFAAPEGGATLAGLDKLLVSGEIEKDERVVLLNTGSGLKYLDVLDP